MRPAASRRWPPSCCGRSPAARRRQLSPEAERGRQVYQAQCIACHNTDPAQPGAIGPAGEGLVGGAPRGEGAAGHYPPGYTPKRPTKVMQPMPQLAGDIPALAAYLK